MSDFETYQNRLLVVIDNIEINKQPMSNDAVAEAIGLPDAPAGFIRTLLLRYCGHKLFPVRYDARRDMWCYDEATRVENLDVTELPKRLDAESTQYVKTLKHFSGTPQSNQQF